MPVFTLEEAKSIKETIKNLDQQSTKEALTSIAQILTTAPTLKASLFDTIISDAFKLTTIKKEG